MVHIALHRLYGTHKALRPGMFGVHAVGGIVQGAGVEICGGVRDGSPGINAFVFVGIGMGRLPAIHFPIVCCSEHPQPGIVGTRVAQRGVGRT